MPAGGPGGVSGGVLGGVFGGLRAGSGGNVRYDTGAEMRREGILPAP